MSYQKKNSKPNWFNLQARPTGTEPADTQEKSLQVTLEGDVPIFANPDTGFAIWAASRENGERLTVSGGLAIHAGGEMLTCTGFWKEHPQHGWGFQVETAKSSLPVTPEGLITWMTINIPGVGPKFAEAIVDHFGPDVDTILDTIDKDPQRLHEVKTSRGTKINKAKVDSVIDIWAEVRGRRQIELFFASKGITANMSAKLYAQYGDETLDVLQNDPYRISELPGIGFKKADVVARSMGITLHDPSRIKAGLLWVMEECEGNGHVFLPLPELYDQTNVMLLERDRTTQLTRDEQALVAAVAQELVIAKKLVVEPDEYQQQRVYRTRTWRREVQLAEKVRWLIQTGAHSLVSNLVRPTIPSGLTAEEAHKKGIFVPTDEQWAAVLMAMNNRISILTGGPGTGKSASQQMIIDAAHRANKKVALAAPTGKAARRMTELTGEEAKTIHRLLEWSPFDGGFARNSDNPLEVDLLVVDEASMLSLDLANHLFEAVGNNTHILLVGDVDQLPPIGAGKVLEDLLRCGVIPSTMLRKIFRQAQSSMIIQNAHRINSGNFPYLKLAEAQAQTGRKMDPDFFWVPRDTAEQTAETVVQFAVDRIPTVFKFDPLRDIQILAPMREGKVGLKVLNAEMQKRLNPGGKSIGVGDLRVGDKVLQTVNDYQSETMNGELGIIIEHDEIKKAVRLSLDDGNREIWIPTANMDSFALGYAISIHKSQGSQFKAIVIPVSTASYVMNTRSLYYTAITRAEKLVVMAGETKALSMSIGRLDTRKRNSTLAMRVQNPTSSGQLF